MLSCALPQYGTYWPLFELMFYFLAPLPIAIARRLASDIDSSSTACKELSIFLTTGLVISSMGLPIVLARTQSIQWGACGLTLAGNAVAFLTILGFFVYFSQDSDYEFQRWWLLFQIPCISWTGASLVSSRQYISPAALQAKPLWIMHIYFVYLTYYLHMLHKFTCFRKHHFVRNCRLLHTVELYGVK